MAKLAIGQPLVTKESAVVVDAGMPAGVHRFQLEVLTDTGQRSPPAAALVQVRAAAAPTGIVSLVSSPAAASTPVVSPHPIAAPAAAPGIVAAAPTPPKTVSPAATSRKTRRKKR